MTSATGRGSGQRLITIGQASHALLRERRGLDDLGIKRLRHSLALSEWLHDAAVRDVRLMLELAASAHPGVAEVAWTNEAIFKRSPIKVTVADPNTPEQQRTTDLVPDGAFTVVLGSGKLKHHYLELDQDTEHRVKLVGRIRAYLKHVGSSQQPVLWVVPSQSRAVQLARWIEQEADVLRARASIFAITTRDQVDDRRVLTHPIWQVVGVAERRSLLPSADAVVGESWCMRLDREAAGV
jgi:hypothetical protein